MDEINEKAIKEIIDYYKRLNKVKEDKPAYEEAPEPVPEETPKRENALSLVDIIEETQRKNEESDNTLYDSDVVVENDGVFEEEINIADEVEELYKPDVTGEAEELPEPDIAGEAEELPEPDIAGEAEKLPEPDIADEAEKLSEPDIADEVDELPEPDIADEAEELPEPDIADEAEESEELPFISPAYQLPELEDDDEYDDTDDEGWNKKHLIIASIITVLLMVFVSVFIMTDSGFIGRYKQNFLKNINAVLEMVGIDISYDDTDGKEGNVMKTGQKNASVKDSVIIPMETAGKSVYTNYRNGIVCAYTNYMTFINKVGDKTWENTTTIVNPILKTAGNYILVAEKGGKKICLYNDSKLVYETDISDDILTCNLSSYGDVVAVTNKAAYKGAIVVLNREGNQIFAWSSGSDNIISADVSAESRRVAVALLNTDEKVKSEIQLFDMNETQNIAHIIFEDTILFDINYVGDELKAFGDNCIAGVTSKGDVVYDKRFDDAEFVHYGMDESGNKILLFDNSNIPLINIYNASADLKYQLSSDEIPDFVDIFNKYIVFNNGRNIIYGKLGKKQLEKYTATMDIKELMMIDKDTFCVVYSNNIEVVRM